MHRQWKQLHGDDAAEDICWFAPSRVVNPVLPKLVVDRALAEDRAKAGAEYENIWREDLSDFVPLDVIEACTDFDVFERPPDPELGYLAACDPASGTGADSYAFTIGHYDRAHDDVVVDLVREFKPRFVPANVIREMAEVLQRYRVSEIWTDRAFAGFHADELLRNGLVCRPFPRTTSENYLAALPRLLAGRVRLIDSATARSQFTTLERRPLAGREQVDHSRAASAHDDVSAAIAGLIAQVADSVREDAVPMQPPYVAVGGVVVSDPSMSAPTGNPRPIPADCMPYRRQPEPWDSWVRRGDGFWAGLPASSRWDRKPW
jgi:hypothetical protein